MSSSRAFGLDVAVMARDCPKHFADMTDDGSDADIADMLTQHLVHGRVIFGWNVPPDKLRVFWLG
jgi:hypothetical protein